MGRSRPLALLGGVAVALLIAAPPVRAAGRAASPASPPAASRSRPSACPCASSSSASGTRSTTSAIALRPARDVPAGRPLSALLRPDRPRPRAGVRIPTIASSASSGAFAARLFAYLRSIGTSGPITPFQEAYNEQGNGVPGARRPLVEVTGQVLSIDAAKAEKWLVDHDPDAADRGYTLYFINWYGRPDFQFHVYTKTDEPDPDTGYNFGVKRATRKMVSWGGTHSRNWFYDFSAGPESWGGSFDVDAADLDGDGSADYRIPPIWEYDAAAIPCARAPEPRPRPARALRRHRPPLHAFTPLRSPGQRARARGPQGRPRRDAGERARGQRARLVPAARSRSGSGAPCSPTTPGRSASRIRTPIDRGARQALAIFAATPTPRTAGAGSATPFAQLFCYFDANLRRYVPKYGPRDYVGEIFAYSTTADSLGSMFGLLGFADDNWVDGTPTYEFVFGSSAYRELGIRADARPSIHEFGHHIGMSHPHDGYDSESGADYDAAGEIVFRLARGRERHRDALPRPCPTASAGTTRTTCTAGRRRAT